jgi:hypothetical protein
MIKMTPMKLIALSTKCFLVILSPVKNEPKNIIQSGEVRLNA